jgi:hypothetical protein
MAHLIAITAEERETEIRWVRTVNPPLDSLPLLDRNELQRKTVPLLKALLFWRNQKRGGTKQQLIDRLVTEPPTVDRVNEFRFLRVIRKVHSDVMELIFLHGDTGHGDKPEGMCRVEYWLAHLEPNFYRAEATLVYPTGSLGHRTGFLGMR